ncbi:MAG: methyltransferase [Lentisphaerae bacterium GWF2_44_16]|nr:MAG: methyltransferase [Lentisphaerae bacterium GWF2_44_16]
MNYPKSKSYNTPELLSKIMGPHPVKLTEELLLNHRIPAGATVLDLGSGQGLSSIFLAKEYGFKVYAGDLWSDPEENRKFFDSMGLSSEQIVPVKADAEDLPFEPAFFDAVVSIDSYNYFGRNEAYLDTKLLPCVKPGGWLYISIPGMKKDCHNNLPQELLLSWTPEQLDYIHDLTWWRSMFEKSNDAELVSITEMESNNEVWQDWLACDNEYAVNDRKSMNAGAGKYFNFISVVLRKKA